MYKVAWTTWIVIDTLSNQKNNMVAFKSLTFKIKDENSQP